MNVTAKFAFTALVFFALFSAARDMEGGLDDGAEFASAPAYKEEHHLPMSPREKVSVALAGFSAGEPDVEIQMPVQDVMVESVVDTFGDPRDGGTRRHEGQDIFASRGTPVYSATNGYVWKITTRSIGGRSVSIMGAGGREYYYTHLDAFAPYLTKGDPVTPYTVIGFVGNDGNADGTPPHLHFGVYLPSGRPINPLPLIVNRSR